MKILRGSHTVSRPWEYPVITIGNFDGVHIGHQSLFRQVNALAHHFRGQSVVLTFDPHPAKILFPGKKLSLLSDFSLKMKQLSELDIDSVVCEPFSRDLAQLSPEDFIRRILVERLGARKILVGSGFTFGHERRGTVDTLNMMGRELGFSLKIIDPVRIDGEVVSSSRIRKLVASGNVEEAGILLDRAYSMAGHVVKGFQIGKVLGIPTANLEMGDYVIPGSGVYASRIQVDEQVFQGVVNVGMNPTFDRGQLSVEAHILDFDREVYGKSIEVSFIRRIRNEIQFASSEDLIHQIQEDIREARTILAGT